MENFRLGCFQFFGTYKPPSDARPFKVPEKMTLMVIDPLTGEKAKFNSKNTIIEALKDKDINNFDNNNLISISGYDNLIKFRQFY